MRCLLALVVLLFVSPTLGYEIQRDAQGRPVVPGAMPQAVAVCIDDGFIAQEDRGPLSGRAALWQALLNWEAPATAAVSFVRQPCLSSFPEPADTFIRVTVLRDSWPEAYGDVNSTLAYTMLHLMPGEQQVIGAEILVNGQGFDFSTTDEPRRPDLEASVTHELGHALGLQHTCGEPGAVYPDCALLPEEVRAELEEATMYPYAAAGNIWQRDLAADDVEGLQHLYPAPFAMPPPPLQVQVNCRAQRPLLAVTTLGEIETMLFFVDQQVHLVQLDPCQSGQICTRQLDPPDFWQPGQLVDLEVSDPASGKRAVLFERRLPVCATTDAGSKSDSGDGQGDPGCSCRTSSIQLPWLFYVAGLYFMLLWRRR